MIIPVDMLNNKYGNYRYQMAAILKTHESVYKSCLDLNVFQLTHELTYIYIYRLVSLLIMIAGTFM